MFLWRGRRLRQPVRAQDGSCVIVDDVTAEIVYQGNPPTVALGGEGGGPMEAGGQGGGGDEGGGAGGGRTSTRQVMKAAVRVAAAPAVAVVRLATATVQVRLQGGEEGESVFVCVCV